MILHKIALNIVRCESTLDEVDAALACLDHETGIYFGVDAGISGMHPLQATLLAQPAIALRLFGDGLNVEPLTSFGEALLELPAMAMWRANARRGQGLSAIAQLRGFLACFQPSPDVLLLGALPFAAHRLAEPRANSDVALGVLFFSDRLMRRDAMGCWWKVMLSITPAVTTTAQAKTKNEKINPVLPSSNPAPPVKPTDDHPPGGYADMVRLAKQLLLKKPLISLTLSQSYRRRVSLSPMAAFKRLRAANPAPASFFLNDGAGVRLFGASPDLQLAIAKGVLQSMPVCGTVARRLGAVGEANSLRELLNEEVDAASLAVCTDALRNDLAPLCEPGSLRLTDRRRPMSLTTVVHAVDRIQGELRHGADAWDAIVATTAIVMVTGTPRHDALQAIAQLETSPRGWYGGMIVQVDSDGNALVGTILRAATVVGDIAEVRTGGDLMADSSPEREEQESRLKTLSLWRAFGLESALSPGYTALAKSINLPPTVHLINKGDAFGDGMRDCLLGLGIKIELDSAVALVCGTSDVSTLPEKRLVAVGDAAYRCLKKAGFVVHAIEPEHGRLLTCTPTNQAPCRGLEVFETARYSTFTLEGNTVPQGWTVWATDGQGRPVALGHSGRRLACLLFRPDSMLSGSEAMDVLRAALEFTSSFNQS
jgi:anthranilate synthase